MTRADNHMFCNLPNWMQIYPIMKKHSILERLHRVRTRTQTDHCTCLPDLSQYVCHNVAPERKNAWFLPDVFARSTILTSFLRVLLWIIQMTPTNINFYSTVTRVITGNHWAQWLVLYAVAAVNKAAAQGFFSFCQAKQGNRACQ